MKLWVFFSVLFWAGLASSQIFYYDVYSNDFRATIEEVAYCKRIVSNGSFGILKKNTFCSLCKKYGGKSARLCNKWDTESADAKANSSG